MVKFKETKTFILRLLILLLLQSLGIKCQEIFKENITLPINDDDTVVLNCTCFRENKSSWKGPSGSKFSHNDTVLTPYSGGLRTNPFLNISNILIYGNYNIGICYLKISHFSSVNNGIYECSYFLSGKLYIRRYHMYSSATKPPTNLKIVNSAENNITYGKEGVRIELTCTVKNGIPAATLIWRKNGLTVANGSNDILMYRFKPTRSDHMQNIACYALSDLLTSPLSQTILLDIQYAPDVKIQYKISKQNITMYCIADGNPNNYTFYDWEHKSEFNEHIRRIHGTPEGHLLIKKAQNSKENEDDGIYLCTVSNGVPDMKGKLDQKGQTSIKSIAPPVFVANNNPVQIGHFGKGVEIEIYIYDQLNNSEVVITSMGTIIMIKPKIKSLHTHDTFHGVNITVPGIKYTFDLDLTSENNFTKYTVEACNDVGCNYFDVQVKSANVGYKSGLFYNYGWYIVGSLFGGSFILSICLNMYCLVKRKKNSGIVSEIPLEIHYDEIGTIHDNSASIQVISNNAQGTVSSPERHAFERVNSHVSDFEQEISSESSLQSLSNSLLNEDGYEHSYETINPENIEIHPYNTVWYNIYENTIICPKEITTRNKGQAIQIDNERDPWLIIYMKNGNRITCPVPCRLRVTKQSLWFYLNCLISNTCRILELL